METPQHLSVIDFLTAYFTGVVAIVEERFNNRFSDEWKRAQFGSFVGSVDMVNPILLQTPCIPATPTPGELAEKFFAALDKTNFHIPIPVTLGPGALHQRGSSEELAPHAAGGLITALLAGREMRNAFIHSGLVSDLQNVHLILVNRKRAKNTEGQQQKSGPFLSPRTKERIRRALWASLINPEALIPALEQREQEDTSIHKGYGVYL